MYVCTADLSGMSQRITWFSCKNVRMCTYVYSTSSPLSQHPSHQWRPAERPTLVQQLPAALVRDLEAREITEEDYDMLLQLDRFVTTQHCTQTTMYICIYMHVTMYTHIYVRT